MAKNLKDYNKADLINIAEQLGLQKNGLLQSKNSTLITKIEDAAEDLGVSVPNPEVVIETPVKKVADGKTAPRRIRDYPRKKITLEARDDSVKEQYVSINDYTATIKVGEEVLIPEPVIDALERLQTVKHVVNSDGVVSPKNVSRFYIKYSK